MEKHHLQEQPKITTIFDFEEVSSVEWELIKMSEQEEDLICRMYRLVGRRWDLIAGRVPGRKPEEIERFWIMSTTQGTFWKKAVNEIT
ncbi:hypothetical protein LguiA_031834 [Lonicera macranthoides]